MIRYRLMTPADIPAGLSLCRSAGWNQIARDWELFLTLSPEGCLVAIDDQGKVAGTVTTVRYADRFSWIGMVLVDPEKQRQGIGLGLLRESLQVLHPEETVKLDATPAGRGVYLKLNFTDEYRLSRMHMAEVSVAALPASVTARPVTAADLPALLDFDREVFGADRKPILEWLLNGGQQYAFLVNEKTRIRGYCFGRSGHNFTHIGPVISEDIDTAIQLVSAALRNCIGSQVVVDALHHTPEWIHGLTSIGFYEQRPLIRMFRGTNTWPGIPEKQFAILGPEFG